MGFWGFGVLGSEFGVFVLRQGQSKSYDEIVTEAHLRDLFTFQLLHTLRCLTRYEVAMAQLTHIVGTPGVAGA